MKKNESLVGRTVFYTAPGESKSTPWTILCLVKCKCACHNKVRLNFVIKSLDNPMYVYGGLCKQSLTIVQEKESNLLQDLAGVGL
jgi:hypothetical protein